MSGSPFATNVRRYRAGVRIPGYWRAMGVMVAIASGIMLAVSWWLGAG